MRGTISGEESQWTKSPRHFPRHKLALSDRQVLNVVSDLGVGPNIRAKDNLYQALAIFVCTLIGAFIGIIVGITGAPWWAGAMVGGFGGWSLASSPVASFS